jgi:hypothetical protein
MLLVCATSCFHVSWLIFGARRYERDEAPLLACRREKLRQVFEYFRPVLFASDHSAFEDFWVEYIRFRDLVKRIASGRNGHQAGNAIWERVGADVEVDGRALRLPRSKINFQTLETQVLEGARYVEFITLRGGSQARVLRWIDEPRDYLLHALLLQLKPTMVTQFRVGRALLLYHRLLVWSLDNEAIAEHVASLVRFVEKKHSTGRPLSPGALAMAVRLRCLGVKGDGTDTPLIDAAMEHFMPKSTFIVADRTWQARKAMDLIGPSPAVSNYRKRILDNKSPLHNHEILSNNIEPKWEMRRLLDDELFTGIDLDAHLPSELPKYVWDETKHHVESKL